MLHSSLRDLRYLRENTHVRVLNLYCSNETQCIPLISQIYADKTQNPTTTTTTTTTTTIITTTCISLRNNAACCIPLRDLRNLRENNTQEYSIYIAQMKPQCIPLISQIYADKTQNNKTATITQPVFLCVIMQLAAFSLRDLRYLRENKHASIHHEETITHHITTSLFTCCVSR